MEESIAKAAHDKGTSSRVIVPPGLGYLEPPVMSTMLQTPATQKPMPADNNLAINQN
eukprot:CAMPEP_0181176644 /NCGR_PEP_ID=MMETSP1096-20121128/4739_1 /TAXON_ID=156174 ORGANISM="Chrysochromulina ericina, Strain CCMP281" /NCGR_SAMPLE_ID=MMETSP1096 /ASSEMBLY_ACC=CAM_ASM_000453 /LENGTH=56 /DNA_ID=CAMNT_0023264745 /DNA_START=616 /DNA_END=783 /DNA_ORIENTATION=+